jgi:predicted solute-binding protein
MEQFRIGLRLMPGNHRMAQVVTAENVSEAIKMVRVGIWANASVASVSIVKGKGSK